MNLNIHQIGENVHQYLSSEGIYGWSDLSIGELTNLKVHQNGENVHQNGRMNVARRLNSNIFVQKNAALAQINGLDDKIYKTLLKSLSTPLLDS